jgi:hypothetical protein
MGGNMKKIELWESLPDVIAGTVIVVLTILTTVLSALNKIPSNLIPYLILMILTTLTVYMMSQISQIRIKMNKEHDIEIYSGEKGAEEYYGDLTNVISKASVVYAINFILKPPHDDIAPRKRYYSELAKRIQAGLNVKRIVSITNREKYEWVKHEQVEKFKKYPNFNLRCYVLPDKIEHIPILTIVLVDSRESFIGLYSGSGDIASPVNIRIKCAKTCDALEKYFSTLWRNAKSFDESKNDFENMKWVANQNEQHL